MIATVFGPIANKDLMLLRERWGLLLAFGLAICGLGIIAFFNVAIATVASVYYVGATMLIAGILQIAYAFQVGGWRPFLTWFLVGLLYSVAGVLAFFNPLLASSLLTPLLGLSLLVVGLLRVAAGFALRPARSANWLMAAGAITLIAGLIVLAGWPLNSVWLIGMLLAVDLTFHGVALSMFAIMLRHAPQAG